MKLLEVKNIVKTFFNDGLENTVINNISFDVKAGEFIAIMGQSGSGKSTLLYSISGMEPITSGQVLLDGVDLSSMKSEELAQIRLKTMGFVFQNNYLLKNLNLFDNICLPGLKADLTSKDEVMKRADQLVKDLGIDGVKHHPIQKVSGGQLQRAAVARALINRPKIVFADEPTGALNTRNSQEVLSIFNNLNANGMTILVVTHDPKVASVTDRIIYLSDGHIGAELELGKRSDDLDKSSREERTLQWLMERGF